MATRTVMVSPDEVHWVIQPMPWDPVADFANCVAENGSMVIVGAEVASGPAIATSTDGISWTLRTSPFDGGNVSGVAWSSTLALWVVVGVDATFSFSVITSPDGITWTTQTSPFDGYLVTDVAWMAGGFVATSQVNATLYTLMYSTDGITWFAVSGPGDGENLNYIATDGTNFVATGVTGFGSNRRVVWGSGPGSGGIDETPPLAFDAPYFIFDVGANALGSPFTLWVLGGGTISAISPGYAVIVTSPNGLNPWTRSTTPWDTLTGDSSVFGVGYSTSRGEWCVCGQNVTNTACVMGSLDGVTWTAVTTPFDAGGYGNDVQWVDFLGLWIFAGFADVTPGGTPGWYIGRIVSTVTGPPPLVTGVPPGYTSGDLVFSDNFANLSNWGTQWGSWAFLFNDFADGPIPSPYTRINYSPTETDDEYFDPIQAVGSGTGAHLTCMPKPGSPPADTSDLAAVSGVLTSFLPASSTSLLNGGATHIKTGGTGYAYVQAIMRQPNFTGNWPGFWGFFLLSGFEFDIQEGGYQNGGGVLREMESNWHDGVASQFGYDTTLDLTANYNIFAAEWIAGVSLTTYFTPGTNAAIGRQTVVQYTSNPPSSSDEFGVIFNLQAANSVGLFGGGPPAYAGGSGSLDILSFSYWAK